jgi:hypothetical protein
VTDSGDTTPPGDGTPRGHDAHGDLADEVGTVAEEAAKFLGALADFARSQGTGVGHAFTDAAGHAAHRVKDVNDHFATGSQDCLYCPVCRVVHYVRSCSPEVKTHLAIAGSSLMHAAAALMATQVPDPKKDSAPMEKIDLDGDWPATDDWDGGTPE